MGRKTFRSMGRPLPKRTNIVITRNPFFVASNCMVARSVEEALSIAQNNGEEEVFIIGGGQIYEITQPFWDRIYFTEVDVEIEEGEVFFPNFDRNEWQLISEERHEADEKNDYNYNFMVFERK
jgi:dihydrofolate reductase